MSCIECKKLRCHDEYNAQDTCAAATKYIETSEGVTENIEMTATEAFDKFRKENGGKCPHFVQYHWWDIFSRYK